MEQLFIHICCNLQDERSVLWTFIAIYILEANVIQKLILAFLLYGTISTSFATTIFIDSANVIHQACIQFFQRL
jgi:hypothetical protein